MTNHNREDLDMPEFYIKIILLYKEDKLNLVFLYKNFLDVKIK